MNGLLYVTAVLISSHPFFDVDICHIRQQITGFPGLQPLFTERTSMYSSKTSVIHLAVSWHRVLGPPGRQLTNMPPLLALLKPFANGEIRMDEQVMGHRLGGDTLGGWYPKASSSTLTFFHSHHWVDSNEHQQSYSYHCFTRQYLLSANSF